MGVGLTLPIEVLGQQKQRAKVYHRYAEGPPAAPPALSIAQPFHAAQTSGIFDVRAFGATGDGKTLDTPAINKAIDAAAAAGGGTVRFPAGTYLCYSIRLKNNIALCLDQGSTILGAETQNGTGYDPAEPNPAAGQYEDFGHRHWHNALIWGAGLENISILGPGLVWGKGLTRGPHERDAGVGDKAISLKNCHNVTIRDVSILQGGHFGILATGVDNFTIENLKIDTNRDGMDIDCCQNVRVSNCTVNSPWDDGICPKSSYGLGYARPTKNLTIINCYVTGVYELGTVLNGSFKRIGPDYPNGPRFPTGRIKCGTESNGGFENIAISNCVFENCRGLALETVDGALLEDITVSNITMREVDAVPIFMRLGSRMRGPAGVPVGKLRRVSITNVVATTRFGRFASILSGIPGHPIEDVRLSDIYVLSAGGGTKQDASIVPPEKENGYPEPTMFGPMPCYGFFIRHVNGIEMSNIELKYASEDQRPAFSLVDVEGADFLHVKAQGTPVLALKDVKDLTVRLSPPVPDTHLESAGEKSL
ncbi:MAG: rhamnogalacturonidase [Terriglobia bacterium]